MNILIAEDDPTLITLLPEMLSRFIQGAKVTLLSDVGLMVTTLQNLAEDDEANHPDVVISDFHLIGGTGDVVLETALRLFPKSKRILMTGGATQTDIDATREKVPGLTFIQKPFEARHLVAAILA